MKVRLLFSNREYKPSEILFGANDLINDLELNPIFAAMSDGNKKIREVVQQVLTAPLTKEEDVLYRQKTLKDVLENPTVILQLYDIVEEAFELKRKTWSWFTDTRYLTSVFSSARELLLIYTET